MSKVLTYLLAESKSLVLNEWGFSSYGVWRTLKPRTGFWCSILLLPVLTPPPPFSSSLSPSSPSLPFLPDLGSVWRVRPLTHTNHQCLPARTEKERQHYSSLLRTLPPKCKSQRDGGEERQSNAAGWEKNRTKNQDRSLQVVLNCISALSQSTNT